MTHPSRITQSSGPEKSPPKVNLRELPSVESAIAQLSKTSPLPQAIIANAVRSEVTRARETAQQSGTCAPRAEIIAAIETYLRRIELSRLQPVINATGVLIHTNLGRSPLGKRTTDFLASLAGQYTNLELDLTTGKRGKRGGYVETALAALCNADAATVTNNCAAAVMLILRHLVTPERNEVIISRGELVEIGGGFRVPEILECSGATLREVGTTNKTRASDYQNAITERTALILRVHRSNFFLGGFTDDPDDQELTAIAREHKLPLVCDLGSGSMMATDKLAPIEHEPMPSEILAGGADLVCFSGDKLLGGPQTGVIAGRTDLVAGIKKDPFFRAVRCDKLILATLQETVTAYLESTTKGTTPDVPVTTMLAMKLDDLKQRANALLVQIQTPLADAGISATLIDTTARTGGGTMPSSSMPSVAIALVGSAASLTPDQIITRLRESEAPLIAYIENDRVEINLRTVFPFQEQALIRTILSLT